MNGSFCFATFVQHLRRGAIALACLVLSACGGETKTETVTVPAPDTTSPIVVATSPASSASGVALNTAVSVSFSETVDPASITTTSFTVGGVTGAVSVSPDRRSAQFTPATPLAANTSYTVTLGTGVKDSAGNALSASVSWSFTTGAAPDISAPTVLLTAPASGATGVAFNGAITAGFSEAMNPDTLSITTFTVSGTAGTVSGMVSVSADQRSVIFTPVAALAPNTLYTATVTTGAKDAAGNPLAGNVSWSFTTAAAPDTVAPSVGSVTPAPGSEANSASSTISVTFSEPLNCASVTINNVQLLEGSTPVPLQTQCSGSTITLLPILGMPTSTSLTASIGPSVTDLAGNTLASSRTWSFGMAPWTRQLGTAGDDIARGVATDAAGNVFIAGQAGDALDGQAGAGGTDIFVTKYDANGTKLWTRQLGTANSDFAAGVATDAAGNVFVAGQTFGALDGQTGAGSWDLFVTKYDGNGTKLWTRQLGSANDDYAYGVATDVAGNVFVAGYTNGALDGQTSAGLADLFVTKYDGNGTKLWTRQLGTAGTDYATGVATDAAGNVFVAGLTYGALDGQTSAGLADLFVTKYDGNGTKLWTRQLGTAGTDIATGVAIDAAGNVFVAGQTLGALDGQTSAGLADLFVTKYDGNGTKLWTRQLGTASTDYAMGAATDAAGNVFVAGLTLGALDGQTSAGGTDFFVTKYDGNGTKLWTRQLGTAGTDIAYGVTTDAAGNVFVAGQTFGALDGQTSAGLYDAFVVKYQDDGRKR